MTLKVLAVAKCRNRRFQTSLSLMTSPQNDDPTLLDETDAETPLLASEPTDSDPAEAQEASHQWWLLLLSPLSHDRDDAKSVFMGMVSMVLVGSILGFVFFGHGSPPELLSGCIGYTVS